MTLTATRSSPLHPRKIAKYIYTAITPDGANLGVIVTQDGMVCIDMPGSTQEAMTWRAELAKLSDKPLRAIMLTSPDRFSGEAASVLAQGKLRTPMFIHEQGFHSLYLQLEMSYPQAPDLGIPFHVREQASLPDLTFSQQASVTLLDRDAVLNVDITHMGGCASGASFITLRQDNADSGVVFTGDHVAIGEPPVFGQGDVEKWVRALAALQKNKSLKFVVPGRGAMGDASILEEATEFVKALRGVMGKMLRRESATREDIVQYATELAAQYDSKPKARSASQMLGEQHNMRIRSGLEGMFSAMKKQTEAVIV